MNLKMNLQMLCLLTMLFISASLWAQEAQDSNEVDGDVMIIGGERIKADIDLPSVSLILQFKGLKYHGIDEPESFLDELIHSVDDDPF